MLVYPPSTLLLSASSSPPPTPSSSSSSYLRNQPVHSHVWSTGAESGRRGCGSSLDGWRSASPVSEIILETLGNSPRAAGLRENPCEQVGGRKHPPRLHPCVSFLKQKKKKKKKYHRWSRRERLPAAPTERRLANSSCATSCSKKWRTSGDQPDAWPQVPTSPTAPSDSTDLRDQCNAGG